MNNREKLLDRARKLFRMSNDTSSQAEAEIAMKRLASLKAEHGFTEAELQQTENHQFGESTGGKVYKSNLPKWYRYLADATSNITETSAVWNIEGRDNCIKFRGMSGDDELAVLMFDYLIDTMNRGLKEYKKETGMKGQKGIMAFRLGFSNAMCIRAREIAAERTKQQEAVSETGQSIMVIKEAMIDAHFGQLTTVRRSRKTSYYDADAFNAGTDAAERTSLNDQIGSSSQPTALIGQ